MRSLLLASALTAFAISGCTQTRVTVVTTVVKVNKANNKKIETEVDQSTETEIEGDNIQEILKESESYVPDWTRDYLESGEQSGWSWDAKEYPEG